MSLLSKIEVGDRALTPQTAAALARAVGMSLGALYGQAPLSEDRGARLAALRAAVRRYDIPDQSARVEHAPLRRERDAAIRLREHVELGALLGVLAGLVSRATTYAHAAADRHGWALLAEVYSVVYALAARNRWMDLVELVPARQSWAAAQRPHPLVVAVAARDRAGSFLNSGDFEGGMSVVDRAVVTAETVLAGPERAFAAGTLHLRGMTVAGRQGDRAVARRHIRAAWGAGEWFATDQQRHNSIFGPANTATHVLATEGDLGRPREVVRLAEQLAGTDTGLPPTRLGPVAINTARARLDLGDRDGAETSLIQAWTIAPLDGEIHPMSRAVLRVLISLHRRSNPQLVHLAQQAGLAG